VARESELDVSVVHDLQTHPEPFQAVWDGQKTYEVRVNDRNFQAGDILFLREWNWAQLCFTGREAVAEVTYLTRGGSWGLPPERCVLGIKVTARTARED